MSTLDNHSKKIRFSALIALAALGAMMVGGCSGGTQQIDPDYLKNAEALGKERREMFTKVNGDYSKLSAEDKAKFLKGFENNEANAQKFWDMMAHPPSQQTPIGR